MSDVHLALFDLYADGHHPEYIAHLCRYWRTRRGAGELEVAGPSNLRDHPDLEEELRPERADGPSFYPLPSTDPGQSLLGAGIAHWRHLASYVRERRPNHVVLMYFDHVQPGLALDLRPEGPTRFSGIYFRPLYPGASGEDIRRSLRERPGFWTRLRKQALFTLARRNPKLERLFVLDPIAAATLRESQKQVDVRALPEPIDPPDRSENAKPVSADRFRSDLGVRDGEPLLLLFGMLTPRKGVTELLEAVERLGGEGIESGTVLLAGPLDENLRSEVEARLGRLKNRNAPRVRLRDAFIPPAEHGPLFEAADALIMPYQQHLGMSAVLARGAAYGLPVLGPDAGTLGALIRRHGLGRTIETSDASALAKAIGAFLREGPPQEFDPERARSFAARHTPEAFARTILEPILEKGEPAGSDGS